MPKKWFDWITDRLEVFFIIFVFLGVFLLLIWFYGNVVYPVRNAQMQRIDLLSEDERRDVGEILIWTPKIIQRDSKPQSIEIVYDPNHSSAITSTLVITINTQTSGLFLVDPDTQKKSFETLFWITTTAPLTQTVLIIHPRTSSLWFTGQAIADIRFSYSASLPAGQRHEGPKTKTLEYSLESGWQAAVQALALQGGPTLLIALAGIISSFYGAIRQADKRKQESQEAKSNFCNLLRSKGRSVVTAVASYEAIQRNYLPVPEVNDIDALIRIVKGDFDDANLLAFENIKTVEADIIACALLLAGSHPGDSRTWNQTIFTDLLIRFPIENLSPEIGAEFDRVREKYGNTNPLQPMKWPEEPGAASSPTLPGEDGLSSPFHCEKAEKDQRFLFANPDGLFWGKHPFFEGFWKLLNENNDKGVSVITGSPGTGKTAIALALGQYIFDQNGRIFALYVEDMPDINRICSIASWRLFDFVKTHPTYLVKLGSDERDLLAALLCSRIGKALVLAELDRMPSSREWKWLYEERAPEVWEIWGKVASGQFKLLRESIATQLPVIGEEACFHALASCCRSLGFEQLRIVIDVTNNPTRQWFRETIAENEQDWELAGWNTLIFANTEAAEKFSCHDEQMFELAWDVDLLLEWARHRWDTLNHPTPLEEVFSDGGLKEMIRLSCENPRKFIQIWNELIALGTTGRFTPADVRKAKAKVDNP